MVFPMFPSSLSPAYPTPLSHIQSSPHIALVHRSFIHLPYYFIISLLPQCSKDEPLLPGWDLGSSHSSGHKENCQRKLDWNQQGRSIMFQGKFEGPMYPEYETTKISLNLFSMLNCSYFFEPHELSVGRLFCSACVHLPVNCFLF